MSQQNSKETPKFGKGLNCDDQNNQQLLQTTSNGLSGLRQQQQLNFNRPNQSHSHPQFQSVKNSQQHSLNNTTKTGQEQYTDMLGQVYKLCNDFENKIRSESQRILDEDFVIEATLLEKQKLAEPNPTSTNSHLPQKILSSQPVYFYRTKPLPSQSKAYVRTQKIIRTGNELTQQGCIGENGLDKVLESYDRRKFDISRDLPKYLPYEAEYKLLFVFKNFFLKYTFDFDKLKWLGDVLNIQYKKLRNIFFKLLNNKKNKDEQVQQQGSFLQHSGNFRNAKSQKRYNNEDMYENEKTGVYKLLPFKLSKQFCAICGIFFCSYHKLHDHDKYNLIFKDTDYSSYQSEDLPHISRQYYEMISKKSLKRHLNTFDHKLPKTLHAIPEEARKYRCSDKSKCFLTKNLSEQDDDQVFTKLKKNELKFVKLIFKITNFQDNDRQTNFSKCFLALHFPHYNCYEFSSNLEYSLSQNDSRDSESIRQANNHWNKSGKNPVDCDRYDEKDYQPCRHIVDKCSKKCECTSQNNSTGRCTKVCSCFGPDGECRYVRKYCQCTTGCSYQSAPNAKDRKNVKECPCNKDNLECDPNYCGCYCQISPRLANLYPEIKICQNTNVLYNVKTRLQIGKSSICPGMGLFAGERFDKDQYIGAYYGEVIDQDEEGRRSIITGKLNTSYIFTQRQKVYIDSLVCGNKLRYVNHASNEFENCQVRMMSCNGMKSILFFARAVIEPGDELFFDYGHEFTLDWKYNFDQYAKWWRTAEKNYKHHLDMEKNKHDEMEYFEVKSYNTYKFNNKGRDKKRKK